MIQPGPGRGSAAGRCSGRVRAPLMHRTHLDRTHLEKRCAMFAVVGRFRFRPKSPEEQQRLVQRMEQDMPPIAQESPGFRGLHVVRASDEELLTLWLWDREADGEAAQPRFGPALQEYVVPNLAQPPERVGGEVVLQVTP